MFVPRWLRWLVVVVCGSVGLAWVLAVQQHQQATIQALAMVSATQTVMAGQLMQVNAQLVQVNAELVRVNRTLIHGTKGAIVPTAREGF